MVFQVCHVLFASFSARLYVIILSTFGDAIDANQFEFQQQHWSVCVVRNELENFVEPLSNLIGELARIIQVCIQLSGQNETD